MSIDRRFKIGDKVILRKSHAWYEEGETDRFGEVVRTDYRDWLDYKVSWGNCTGIWFNGARDLKPASVIYLEDHLKEKDIL